MRETVMGYNAYHPPVEELDLTTGTLSMDRESRWTVSLHNMEFIFLCKSQLFSKIAKTYSWTLGQTFKTVYSGFNWID